MVFGDANGTALGGTEDIESAATSSLASKKLPLDSQNLLIAAYGVSRK